MWTRRDSVGDLNVRRRSQSEVAWKILQTLGTPSDRYDIMKIPWTVGVRWKFSLSGVLPEINSQWNEKNVSRNIRRIPEDVENEPRTGFIRLERFFLQLSEQEVFTGRARRSSAC